MLEMKGMKYSLLNLNKHVADIVRGASVAFVLKITAAAAAFIVNVVLARLLGSDGVGIYFLSLAVVTLASTVGRFGTDNLVVREIAREAACDNWVTIRLRYREVLRLLLTVSVPVTAIIAVFSEQIATVIFSKPELAEPLRIMSIGIIPLSVFNLYANSLKGLKKVKESVAVQNLFLPVITLITLYVIATKNDLHSATIAYVIAVVLTAFVALFLWKKAVSVLPVHQQNEVKHGNLLASAKQLFVIAILTFGLKWLSTIFLGIWGESSDVGIFNIAQRTAMLTSFILVAVNTISAPKFAELYQKNDMRGLEITAINSTRLSTLFALPLLCFFLITPSWVMQQFGNEFVGGAAVLSILAVGQFINVATGSVAYLLLMTGRENVMMKIILITSVLGVTLNAILIPVLGGVGAAIATAISMSTQNIIAAILVYRKMGISTLPLFRILFARKSRID